MEGKCFWNRSLPALILALALVIVPWGSNMKNIFAMEMVNVEINGYQISTTVEGFRTVYSVIDPENEIVSAGLIYGLTNHVSEEDMVISSRNSSVYSFEATNAGKLNKSFSSDENAKSYAMTMKFIKLPEFYDSEIIVRAYAQLSDGTYIYSNTSSCSVYRIADTLYQNMYMNTEDGHDYLYNNILSVVNPAYQFKEYDWNHTIVNPGETTSEQSTTKAPEITTPEITTPETTTPETTTVPETTTRETLDIEIPDSDKATGEPGKPAITHDNWDNDGEYIISSNMWYGNNATCYVLYEKKGKTGAYKAIKTGTLTDDSPNAQCFTIDISGKTMPGTYWYYIEVKNKYGGASSDEISVSVGGTNTSKLVIDTIDEDEVVDQYVMSQGTYTYKINYSESDQCDFKVISSNTSVVKASIVNGDELKLEAVSGGRTGIKLMEIQSGEVRYFGVRVKESNGSLADMPSYLALGQVSEDSAGDLKFWQDTSDNDTNKRMDVRYIYINGGPINGWQSWSGDEPEKRVKSYITESLKLGIVPYFVYYNIPDGSESYDVDYSHINDKEYMEAYYKDLVFFLETCDKYDAGETVGIILEPDFIGYMMQNSGMVPSLINAAGVGAAYSSGILTKGVDPDFPNTLEGIVKSINYIINKKYPSAIYGWQFNTWSYSNGVPSQGLMHATETMGFDSGRNFIKNAARKTAEYYMSAGILSYGADFISIDKYGLDGAYQGNAAENPKDSSWLWNSDLWNNYLYYTKTLHETTEMPVTLWQIPVGHLNHSLEANPYNNGLFPDLTNQEMNYEDSAPTYFFGDTFEPGSTLRMNYFATNAYNDSKVSVNGNTITYGSHMQEAADAGVTCILFGAGVGSSTDAVGYPPSDSYWWITKAQRYYNNPVWLK